MDLGRLRFQGSGTLDGDEPSLVVKAATANRSQGGSPYKTITLTRNCYAFATPLLRASSKSCVKYPTSGSALCLVRSLLLYRALVDMP